MVGERPSSGSNARASRTTADYSSVDVAPLVTCPNPAASVDPWLTNQTTGEPTQLFKLMQVSCCTLSATICCGTFATPSLANAYELDDTLLFGGVLASALVGPAWLPILSEARRVCRCTGEEAPLLRLGAGTALISAERHAGLKKYVNMVDQRGWLRWAGISTSMAGLGFFLVSGWGVHSKWHNRCSIMACTMWYITAFRARGIWTGTLHVASELVASKIDVITTTLKEELHTDGTDMSLEDWETTVAQPVRALIRDDLDHLSRGWARGALLSTLLSVAQLCSFVCLALSSKLGPWAVEHSGVARADIAIAIVFAFATISAVVMPLLLLAAPAGVSTSCDDLKEKLNEVRINDLSPEVDNRLIILERAMANVNHGQGVGFKVFGIVVDKQMLKLMAVKLVAASSAACTTLIAMTRPSVRSDAVSQCHLSNAEAAAVQGVMQMRNMSCVYNVSLDAVLGMAL
eukprot:COSAG02_NODE_6075_length_3821_cov_16.445401_2_plen_461_part_00